MSIATAVIQGLQRKATLVTGSLSTVQLTNDDGDDNDNDNNNNNNNNKLPCLWHPPTAEANAK